MTGNDSDEREGGSELEPPAATEVATKLTPPPKPVRDPASLRATEAARNPPSIPGAPRVPLIPVDHPPRAEGPLSRSDPPRPRQRSDTPRLRATPSARVPARAETPSERARHPSFPLPPPAPVSLSEGTMPLVSRSGPRGSVPAGTRADSSPALAVGSGTAEAAFEARRARESSPPRVESDPARLEPERATASPALEIAPPPLAPQAPAAADYGSAAFPSPVPSLPAEPERPSPSVAILAMKIIAVGAPASDTNDIEQDIEIHVDVPETASDDLVESAAHAYQSPLLDRITPEPVELSDADVAPDSMQTPVPAPANAAAPAVEVSREEAISIPPLEIEADTPVPEPSPTEEAKPPPPPRRKSNKPPAGGKALPQAKKRQRRPWWEDVFAEEFIRAAPRVSQTHVRREVDFIESSLGVAPGGVVLDLGCGAGHHVVELAARGYGVVGYDLSLYQLSLANEVAQARAQKINFVQGDMREMAFEEMFDGVFSWNTSFGYFEEEKNHLVLERVFRALKPGGMFLIDVVNRDFAASQSPSQNWYEGDGCVCMDDMSLDFITSRLRVKRSVILDDGRTRECTYSIRVYSLHELGKLLHDVGFRVTEATGHPSVPGVFFGEHSPRIIVVAQKP